MARGRKKTQFNKTFIDLVPGKAGIRPRKKLGKDLSFNDLQSRLKTVNSDIKGISASIKKGFFKNARANEVKTLLANRVKDTLEAKKSWIEKTLFDMKKGVYPDMRKFIVRRYDMALKNERAVLNKLGSRKFNELNKNLSNDEFNTLIERHSDLFYSDNQVVKGLETIINRDGKYQDLAYWDERMDGHTLSEFAEWLQATEDPDALFQSFYNYGNHIADETKLDKLLNRFVFDCKNGEWPLK